mmetsp:Transcript_13334/g.28315  ORF Transcript_13334/g.28315 Transcript_13334/m.28315 type:complete len:383 (-) Transcript_13334:168-1316(-)|eukprot:CAMPEP_0118927542 /NCGR_PEP_ID=MMETSP1169-20130426/4985_1 /TAXON_ID=36882 /ORGANISM="Pyramimonas obovata, Strain CCMP722" /LENGTH=382 /DNA_ID=CAMNT_0006869313 /DNA_START=34 /DNA_END=1182 /DNA_ORIENTATION=+
MRGHCLPQIGLHSLIVLGLEAAILVTGVSSLPRGTGVYRFEEAQADNALTEDNCVLLYFTLNGQDGLHIAHSTSGREFTPVAGARSVLAPSVGKDPLMRDPSAVQTPDGVFHLVWTTGWEDKGFGYTTSRDLITFEEQREVRVMRTDRRARNVWAPDISYDESSGLLTVVWSSTVRGAFPETAGSSENGLNHRLYYTTWEPGHLDATLAPARLFYDPGFNVIDGHVAWGGDRWLLFLKDERRWPPRKTIHLATSDGGPHGPFSSPGEELIKGPFWAEGPTALYDEAKREWTVYFEKYAKVEPEERPNGDGDVNVDWICEWGAVTSRDLKHWKDISHKLSFPEGARHGTVLRVPPSISEGLLRVPRGRKRAPAKSIAPDYPEL